MCSVPDIGIGNKPIDGGNYLFTDEEKKAFVKKEPASEPFFKKWIAAKAFLIEINVNSFSNCGLGINLGFFLTAPVRPTLS